MKARPSCWEFSYSTWIFQTSFLISHQMKIKLLNKQVFLRSPEKHMIMPITKLDDMIDIEKIRIVMLE